MGREYNPDEPIPVADPTRPGKAMSDPVEDAPEGEGDEGGETEPT